MAKSFLRRYRILLPFVLAFSALFVFVPGAYAHANTSAASLVGPKSHYLALGDSLAYGYQPNFDFSHGYADYFYSDLQTHGTSSLANMGCPGETSSSFINGGCSYSVLRKYVYSGAQLNAAVNYLTTYSGQVSPVTLDIGANDLLSDFNKSTCTVSSTFQTDLQTVDTNLKQVILPKLSSAMTVNGTVTGDLLLMNYYDPYQNLCPQDVSYTQEINQHLAADVSGYGSMVDVFTAFGGATTPNPNICNYTWMCSVFSDIHGSRTGYGVMAKAFESAAGY